MDRGGVYKMDRQTKCKQIEMPLKWKKLNKIFLTGTRMCCYILSISVAFQFFATSSFQFCDTWSVHLFYRHFLFYTTHTKSHPSHCTLHTDQYTMTAKLHNSHCTLHCTVYTDHCIALHCTAH